MTPDLHHAWHVQSPSHFMYLAARKDSKTATMYLLTIDSYYQAPDGRTFNN